MKWPKWSSLLASLIALVLVIATIATFRMNVNAATSSEVDEIAPLRASPAFDKASDQTPQSPSNEINEFLQLD
jgi:hypothetical protein